MATTAQLCAVRRDVLAHVGNRWSSLVLTLLADAPRPYSVILKSCAITPRMLTLNLRELERDGLITRVPAAGARARVAYALTDAGRSLCSIIGSLISWSDQHHEHIVDSRDRFAAAV
ncbi:transcriptional regulator [Actinoplanes sp. L3-i22]|nr:transcriptional regulator [Actinoplanes sp. L3-i22]